MPLPNLYLSFSQSSDADLIPRIRPLVSIEISSDVSPHYILAEVDDDYYPHFVCFNSVGKSVCDIPLFDHNPEKNKNLRLLDSFKDFPNNWDNKNAFSFESTFIDKVKEIVSNLTIQPNIFPTSRNSIQLEYEKRNEDYLEIEIFPNNSMNVLTMIGDSEVEYKIKNGTQIQEQVISFYVR